MNELSSLKPYTCNDHIKDKNDDMVKKPSIAANIFNDHFCSIHRTVSNRAQPGSNIYVDGVKTTNHSKLQNKNFEIVLVEGFMEDSIVLMSSLSLIKVIIITCIIIISIIVIGPI